MRYPKGNDEEVIGFMHLEFVNTVINLRGVRISMCLCLKSKKWMRSHRD